MTTKKTIVGLYCRNDQLIRYAVLLCNGDLPSAGAEEE